ncbi:MAG: hypothetical protein IPG74_04365 [Flavobacteriales bacterium]|nr:hypothetical protein [Flavobacteriales bacterium]
MYLRYFHPELILDTYSIPPEVIDGIVSFAATGRNVSDLTVRLVEEFRKDPG